MNNTTDFLSYKKKREIKEQLSTQGWNSVIFDPENVKHTIYFYDMVSGHLQISSLTNSREIVVADIIHTQMTEIVIKILYTSMYNMYSLRI